MKKTIIRVALGTALAVACMLPVGQATFADRDWSGDCHRRLEADHARIDRDAARHGEHSRQVDRDVARMNDDRRWCSDHHSDWDHSRFDVGLYFKH